MRLKNLINEAWSGIDIQLKRRYDLIPNLVSTVKGYSNHETQLFEQVTKLRSSAMQAKSIDQKAELENNLSSALNNIFVISENYPELKANQNFIDLQKELANIENQIQLSRRYYNGVTRTYNTEISIFPANVIANSFNFLNVAYFELNSTIERETPQVNFK